MVPQAGRLMEKVCERCDLGPWAIRWSLPYSRERSDEDAHRCMPWNGLSSSALVVVLALPGLGEKRQLGAIDPKDSHNRSKVRLCLDMFAELLNNGEEWQIELCLGPAVVRIPGVGVFGKSPLKLPVVSGMVVVDSMVALPEESVPAPVPAVAGQSREPSSSLISFLQASVAALDEGKASGAWWFFKQLVWPIGQRLHDVLCLRFEGTALAGLGKWTSPRKRCVWGGGG